MKAAPAKSVLSCLSIIIGLAFAGPSSAQIDPESIVGLWLFDEGNGDIANDSSQYGNDGEIIGAKREQGKSGGALSFDGVAEHVRVPDVDALNPGEGSFSITYWTWIDPAPGTSGDTNWDLQVAKRLGGSNGYYVGAARSEFGAGESGIRFMLGDTSNERRDTPYVQIAHGEWAFVAAVLDRDADQQKISVNGGEWALAPSTPPGPISNTTPLGIGWDIGMNNFWHHGLIDEVAMFNVALSDDDIRDIMTEGFEIILAVFPAGKLTTTWASIKTR